MPSWKRFTEEFRKDLKQWLFFMMTLSFFRVLFIVSLRGKIEADTPWTDLIKAVVNGVRYDTVIATLFILIPLLLTVLSGFCELRAFPAWAKKIYGSMFVIASTAISIISLAYFKEYNDHFNHFVFNLYYDDTEAILSTIWAEYNVVLNLLAIGLLSLALVKAYLLFMKSRLFSARPETRPKPLLLRIAAVFFVTVLVLVGVRGSYGHRTVKIEDAAVTQDAFLNKAVLNPYNALQYAYVAHLRMQYVLTGLQFWLPDQDVRKAAQTLYRGERRLDDLDEYLKRTAPGSRNSQPKHIFLTVMESYDAWPLLEEYRSLGLSPELGSLAVRGVHVRNFLPSSDGTATSLTALVSGLADANVITNYQNSSSAAYPSSIAESFKRLGYRTRFFYGGYLSWQKIGDFVKGQGFDEVYGAAHIGSWAAHNEWGVEDEALFNFVAQTVGAADSQPSLNLILTTSYHPPYELDVYGKGFSLTSAPDGLAEQFDNSVSLKMLGHLWYSDRCIGDFVRKAEKQFPASLFAFTGDHFSRKFINIHPGKFEASAVPFILYGNFLRGVSASPEAAGSHIDIGPTLIELIAPKGFVYHAVGRSLLGPEPNRMGISRDRVITGDFIYDIWEKKFFPLPGKQLPKTLPKPADLKYLHGAQAGISWWRIMRGPDLNAAAPQSAVLTRQ